MSKFISKTAIIATLYFVLTVAIPPLSYGAVQFRFSECLTVLVIFYPEAVVGLTVGCFFSNLFGNGLLDVVFGTLATFLSSLIIYFVSKKLKNFGVKFVLFAIFNILFNVTLVPISFVAYSPSVKSYFTVMSTIAVGQVAVISSLALIVGYLLNKLKSKGNIDFL